jgi:hypothetical protein
MLEKLTIKRTLGFIVIRLEAQKNGKVLQQKGSR